MNCEYHVQNYFVFKHTGGFLLVLPHADGSEEALMMLYLVRLGKLSMILRSIGNRSCCPHCCCLVVNGPVELPEAPCSVKCE